MTKTACNSCLVSIMHFISGFYSLRCIFLYQLAIAIIVASAQCIGQVKYSGGPPSLHVNCLSYMNDSNQVVAATTGGVFLLTEGRWTPTAMMTNITALAVNPAENSEMVAGLLSWSFDGELHKSTDRGSSWNWVSLGGGSFSKIQYDPIDSSTIYATGPEVGMILVSHDRGSTWSHSIPATESFYPIDIAINKYNDSVIYVLELNGRVWRSSDFANNWIQIRDLNGSINPPQDSMYRILRLDPHNQNFLYVGGPTLLKSTNAGNNWSIADFNKSITDIVFDNLNHDFFIGTNAYGVWKSSDSGGTFQRLAGLDSTKTSSLLFTITNRRKFLFVGTQDSGVFYYDLGAAYYSRPNIFGWNMISVPLEQPFYVKHLIYPSAASNAFTYNDGYIQKDTLKFGSGYWLKFDYAGSLDYDSGNIVTNDSIEIFPNWNMIGSISVPIDTAAVITEPTGILRSGYYGYDGTTYFVTDSIRSGQAYWVKSSQAGKLIMKSNTIVRSSEKK